MIGFDVKIKDDTKKIEKAVEKAAFKNFGHAAARISKDMKESLVTATGPSPPGSPPHTHRGAHLRRAVRFAADDYGAVIGPMESIVGEAGAAHEHGGEFRGANYPERPFAEPALMKNIDRIAGDWKGSIGE